MALLVALWHCHSGVRPTQAIWPSWPASGSAAAGAVSLGVPLPVALSVRVDWQ